MFLCFPEASGRDMIIFTIKTATGKKKEKKKRKHFAWMLSRVVRFESTTRRMSASSKVHYAEREALVQFA